MAAQEQAPNAPHTAYGELRTDYLLRRQAGAV
jgi:hypothetical protein